MKKLLLATLAYAAISMAIAFPWHFSWFKELYESFGIYNRAEPIVPLGLATLLIQGLILASLYPRWYKGGSPLQEGLKFGLLMGLFLFSVSTLANAAKIEVSSMTAWIAVQAAFHALQFSLSGLAIGWIHRPKPTG